MADSPVKTVDTDSDEDDEFHSEYYDVNKRCALVLVDVNDSAEGREALTDVLEMLGSLMEEQLLSTYHNTLALFWTGRQEPVFTFTDDLVDNLTKLDEVRACLQQQKGLERVVAFGDAFVRCARLVPTEGKVSPSVVVVTDRHTQDDKPLILGVKGALGPRVTTWLVPVSGDFDMQPLYGELADARTEWPLLPDNADRVLQLLRELSCSRSHTRRHYLELCENPQLGLWVQASRLHGSHKLMRNVCVSRITGHELSLGKPLQPLPTPDEASLRVDHCDFRHVQVLQPNQVAPYGFRLLRVAPPQASLHRLAKPPLLIEPDETQVAATGASLFECLRAHCQRTGHVLVCSLLLPGQHRRPRHYELGPTEHAGRDCLLAMPLSFYWEVGDGASCIPWPELVPPPPEHLQALAPLVDRLTVATFDPDRLYSAEYERKAAMLRALLLGREQPDRTPEMPDAEQVQARLDAAGDVDLARILELFGEDQGDAATGTKRKAAVDSGRGKRLQQS